jgi:hypothetical protein
MVRAKYHWISLAFALIYSVAPAQLFQEGAVTHGMQHLAVASDFMGAAVAVFDYNNDGWQDVYLTGGLEKDKLYKNLGNGVFSDVTSAAGGFSASTGYKTTSVVTADLNNDGFREIIVGTARNMPMFIYKNNGDGTFTHVTPSTGITSQFNTYASVTGDYDLDGKLDIYIINYVQVPRVRLDGVGDLIGYNHTCAPNELYRNLGGLAFQEVSGSAGVMDTVHVPPPPADGGPVNSGCGLAGLFTDINGDYLPDLYVANDFGMFTRIGNAYYQNNYPTIGFSDRRAQSGLDAEIFGMGIAQGDYDKDGKLDLYVTNLGRNILYRQTTPGSFSDVTTAAGVEDAKDPANLNVVSWGTAFFDYDNDGYEDLYVSNGYVPAAKAYETSQASENKLYHNLKNGAFEDVSALSTTNDKRMHRGMAVGDFDNDGDEDMIVTKLLSTGVPVQDYTLYYINQQNLPHHWLQVSVVGNGTTTNRDGFGATVKVHYALTHGVKSLSGGSSHASQNSSVLHFGIGTATTIDSVEVFWPGGSRTRVMNPPIDKHIRVEQGIAGFAILGCMNTAANNYDNQATVNYGCYSEVRGCTTVGAFNYNSAANTDDGSCQFVTALPGETIPGSAVYPNPLTQSLTVRTAKASMLELFDVQGRRIFQVTIDQPEITVQPELAPGLYIYRLTSYGHVIQTGKLVKQ